MKPLSEKRIDTLNGYKYSEEDVKEAVARLKDRKKIFKSYLEYYDWIDEIMGRFEK